MQFIRWSNSLFVFSLLATLSTEQWQGQWHQLGRWQQDIQPPLLPQNVWPSFSPQGVLPQNALGEVAFPQDVLSSSDPLARIPSLPKPVFPNPPLMGVKNKITKCEEVFAHNGFNSTSFYQNVAHGIHSLFLEEIREYFESDAPERNHIPVVNTNLSSEQPILFNSPLAGYDNLFYTMALKVVAFFMRNDAHDFYVQGVNTLEKLTHQMHMQEIYAAASPIYRSLKENPPSDVELCPCVNDVTANGVLNELTVYAQKLKYYSVDQRPPSYPPPEMISLYESEYLDHPSHDNAKKLVDLHPWLSNTLVGPEQWMSYEAMMTASMLDNPGLNDFATFIFCKLNHPEEEHPDHLFD